MANTNYKFTNGTDTVEVRIDGDINLAGTPVPTYDTLNITGLGGQFATSATGPFLNGYQLLPRYAADIEKYINPNTGSVHNTVRFTSVYPNPSNGNMTIFSKKPMDLIVIYSLSGQNLFQKPGVRSVEDSINAYLPQGVYILKVISGNEVSIDRISIR